MRWLRNPLAILLVGVAFRILLIPSVLKWIGTPANPFEGNEASHIAAHMVRGDGFASPFTDLPIPTAQQPPLYPWFMAGIFKLFGTFSRVSLYVILGANCIVGSFTALFLHQVGLKYFSSHVALFSAWMWSVFPPIAITDITLSSYAFASLALVLWLKFVPTLAPKASNWILLGIATGVMLLLNPMLILLLPASVLWLDKQKALAMSATALLCIAPWYVRNYRVLGHFYPALRDNLGMELYLGNHAGMSGTCDYWTGDSPYGSELPKTGEARFFELRRSDAIAYVKSAPKDFFVRSAKRFGRFWFTPWPIVYVILLSLAIWGTTLVPRPFAAFTAFLFVCYPLVFYVTQAAWATAYRHPIEPLILLMSAEPLCRFLRTSNRFRVNAQSRC
jgi:hypothetical protein